MPSTPRLTLAVAAVLGLGLAAQSIAQDAFVVPSTPEEIVAARQDLMKEDGGILRNAGSLSGAEAVAAMTTVLTNYSHIPALFPEGSIVGDSRALPVIWERWDDFVAIATTGQTAAQAAIDAANAGDSAGYAAALETLGETCGACHGTFRGR